MREALEIHRDNEARGLEGLIMGNLGVVAMARGQLEQSEELLRGAIAIHQQMDNLLLAGADNSNLAATLIEMSRFTEAMKITQQALPTLLASRAARETQMCRCNLAMAHACMGQVAQARQLLDEATEAQTRSGAKLADLMSVTAAHVQLAEARAEGAAADDPRVRDASVLIAEYRACGTRVLLPLLSLTRVVEGYPRLPSEVTIEAQ